MNTGIVIYGAKTKQQIRIPQQSSTRGMHMISLSQLTEQADQDLKLRNNMNLKDRDKTILSVTDLKLLTK